MSRERHWIVVSEDGRHVTLGRHTDPTAEELDQSSQQLARLGLAGWLVVLQGSYYEAGGRIALLMVRELAQSPKGLSWKDAEVAFRRLREESLAAA